MNLRKIKFVNTETRLERVHRVLDELVELEEAVVKDTNIAEETGDVILAAYQMFHHLGYSAKDVYSMMSTIEEKNDRRGYYTQ